MRHGLAALAALAVLIIVGLAFGESRPRLISPIELSDEEQEWLSNHRRIRAYFEPWPPFLIDENGSERGIAVDYLELICAELNIDIDWVHIEWSKAIADIRRQRSIDVLPILTHNSEREHYIAFTRDYISFPIVIFTHRPSQFFVGGLDDLRGRVIAVERDYAIHNRLRKQLPEQPLQEVRTTGEALEALATGRADAYIGNLAVASYVIEEQGLSNITVAAPSPFGTHDQAIGVRQDWPILATLLDRGLDSITTSGHNTIRQRWLSGRDEYGIRPNDIAKWAIAVGLGIGLLLLLSLLWNRRLHYEVEDRRKAEKELEKSQAQLLEAQRLSKIGSWTHYVRTGKLSWSSETFHIFGLDPRKPEPLFEQLAKLIHPDDWKAFKAMVRAARKLGDRYETELRVHRSDGTVRIAVCRGGPIQAKNGEDREATVLVGTVQDVTERRIAEAERRRLRDHMRRTQKLESLGVLAGGIAHDFNNILATIMGNTQMAYDDLAAPSSESKEYLEEVLVASRRAAELCNQMLAYSGRTTYAMEPVQLSSLIEDMAQMLTATISKKATLSFNFPADLPPIMADAAQIRQMIVNLVSNASDALANKPGTITITGNARSCDAETFRDAHGAEELPAGQYVVLRVQDNGVGMNDTTQKKLFEPFFSTKCTGKGLGLAAVLGIVRSHNGAVRIQSAPRKGCRVTLYFPAQDLETAPKKETKKKKFSVTTHPTPPPGHDGGLVLVVDDEEQVLTTVERILAKQGYTVLKAKNGSQAIEIFRENASKLSCVVLDLIMPVLDGKEAFRELQKINDSVPVIMMSGYDLDEIERRFGNSPRPVEIIHKPFEYDELAGAVDRATHPDQS